MDKKKIGTVTHFFPKISVAVIKLAAGPLKVGDTICIEGHGKEFTQKVGSMQIEHESIQSAKKGHEFGMKVDDACKEGDIVYKTS